MIMSTRVLEEFFELILEPNMHSLAGLIDSIPGHANLTASTRDRISEVLIAFNYGLVYPAIGTPTGSSSGSAAHGTILFTGDPNTTLPKTYIIGIANNPDASHQILGEWVTDAAATTDANGNGSVTVKGAIAGIYGNQAAGTQLRFAPNPTGINHYCVVDASGLVGGA